MKKNTISIIVATYNWPEALELCLLSITRQTLLPNEVIIADDGSTKSTAELIKRVSANFPCPIKHIWHEDIGFRLTVIRNKAIAKTSGDYVIQIDGDIILHKNFVKDHMTLAKQNCFVSGSRIKISDKESKKRLVSKNINISYLSAGLNNRINGMRCPFLMAYFRFRYKSRDPYYVKGCNMAFWRENLLEANGYNEDMVGWGSEDSELAARLIAKGIKRQFIKFGGIEFHLEHPFQSRDRNNINLEILHDAIDNKRTYCENGLSKYL